VRNRSSTGKSRGYACSPPCDNTMAKPGVTVSPPWTQLIATVLTDDLTVEIRLMPEELRWCPGISRRCFAAWCVPVSTMYRFFLNLKPPVLFPGAHRFNTVYPDSRRCLPAPLRCGPGRFRCPHRSDAGTEILESVYEALYFIYRNVHDNFRTHDKRCIINKYIMKINTF